MVSFGITKVKNPSSFRTTDSIEYTVYDMADEIVERKRDANVITNQFPGEMVAATNGVLPDNF
jgi:hypothetical protein